MRGKRIVADCGFTLIELLVVIAIIAILAAILLPVLSRAREAALRSVCISQHKQQVLAAFMYTDDHNGQFPNTDGSWLDRMKNGQYQIKGFGTLYYNDYLNLDYKEVQLVFCPSAKPTWNYRSPRHVLKYLTTNIGDNPEAYSTTVGKFCTFVGYNTVAQPTRANLYVDKTNQTAAKMSPILTCDYIWNHTLPRLDSRQSHHGEGSPCGFYDGSVQWVDFDLVYDTGSPGFGGVFNNRNPYGNFWHWSKATYGQ